MQCDKWFWKILYAEWEVNREMRKYNKIQSKGPLSDSEYNYKAMSLHLKLSWEFNPYLFGQKKGQKKYFEDTLIWEYTVNSKCV